MPELNPEELNSQVEQEPAELTPEEKEIVKKVVDGTSQTIQSERNELGTDRYLTRETLKII